MKARTVIKVVAVLIIIWLVSAWVSFVAGCTVTPSPVHREAASLDGNAHNSGFIGYNPDGSGKITAHAKSRYDALAKKWGDSFIVPVRPGDGCKENPDGTWTIDAEHLTDFLRMNEWQTQGRTKP